MKKQNRGRRRKPPKPRNKRPRAAAVPSRPPPPAARPPESGASAPVLTEARLALREGRPADAVGPLRRLLASAPADADAFNLLGVAAFQMGDLAEARSLLETAAAFRPGFADALNNLGNVLKETGDPAAAAAAYHRALAARPGHLDAQFNLGVALELMGRFAEAEANYRNCLAQDPGFKPALFNLANVLKALGRVEEAIACYRRTVAHDPRHAPALANLGAALLELGRGADAVAACRRAVAADPGFAEAHYNLGIALQETKDLAAAIQSYEKALDCDPQHAGARFNIGYALRQAGRLDEAVEAYRRAIAAAPDYDKAHVNLGDAHLERGEAGAALKVADDFLAGHPGNVSMLAFKAIVLNELGLGKDSRALLDFDRLILPVRLDAPQGFADLKAFNRALSDHVLGHPSLTRAPASHATRNGRHSGELLVEPKGPMAAFEQEVMAAVAEYRARVPIDPKHPYLAARPEKIGLAVWGVVMDAQGHQVAHIHPSAWLSGVYYAKIPKAVAAAGRDHAGWIEFGRPPDDFHARKAPKVKLHRPEEGLMLLFPSYFYHRTIPFESAETRISIAFDVLARD